MSISVIITHNNALGAETKLSPIYSTAETHLTQPPGLIVVDLSNEKRFSLLSDALKSVNSLQVLDSGVPGDPVLVSIQGASSQQTRLLINGIPTNSSQWGTYDVNKLPIDFIERIEIHTSSHSQGINQGIGGTINIITKKTTPSSLNIGVGSYGKQRFGMHYAIGKNQRLSISHQKFANDYRLPIASPADNPQAQNQKQSLKNAEFSITSAQYHYVHSLANVELNAAHSEKGVPDYFRNTPLNSASLEKKSYGILITSNQKSFFNLPKISQNFHLSIKQERENFKDIEGTIGLSSNDDVYDQEQLELSWKPDYSSESIYSFLSITTKFDQFSSQHRLDDDSFLCTTPQGSCDQKAKQYQLNTNGSVTVFSQDKTHSLTSQASLFQVNQENSERNNTRITQSDDVYEQYALIYELDANSPSLDELRLKIGFEKNIRIPSLFERFGDRGLLIGNQDLKAETGRKWFIELPYQYKQVSIAGSLFHRDLDNAIVAVYDSRGVGRYENTSKAAMSGLELKVRLDKEFWYYQISTSQYDSETQSTQVKSFNNKQLPGIYHNMIQTQLGFSHHHWKGNLEYQYADKLYIDRSNLAEGDEREIVNAYLEYEYSSLTLTLSIQNLTNNQFNDYTNRPVVGRQWMINSAYYF
ncbi:Outer membrane cobalamin receptor protein [Oceanobacter sp. RED65]|uniref:Outer membrane cobalamin receptor protein n=1 Tax=Bermanella marisrubri TaxID=207949 RepID=Q1MXS7_9GAMM|nr:Outer membrane cobalamin receptor protein [Oceanobacter sp. RED65] [Bermanella marisrubri]